MRPLGVHHVQVNVRDVDASVAFYTNILGARVRQDRPDLGVPGAWLNLGEQQVHLIEASVPPDEGQHFALHVEHLDDLVAELRSGGLVVTDPAPIGTDRQSFLHDPSHNLIELHEVSDPAASSAPAGGA